jgi:hypothetical protein
MAREAQHRAQASIRERVQRAVQRIRTTASPARTRATQPGFSLSQRTAALQPIGPQCPSDHVTYAQAGLLNLAASWQEAGATIRAIHVYMDLLERYPDSAAAAAAVSELAELSEKLVDDGQFHTALGIYDRLEELTCATPP